MGSWLDRITEGDIVFLGSACGEPQTLVEALVAQRDRWRGLQLLTGLQGATAAYARDEYADSFHLTTFMSGRAASAAYAAGRADHIPASVFQTARLLDEGRVHIDAALVQVSPPDADGWCSLGVSVAYNRAAVRAAPYVVAEVNEQMPRTRGDALVHVSEIDEIVPSDRPVIAVKPPTATAALTAIGEQVAALVPNGATVQIGVGGVSDSIWRALSSHRDLSVHAGAVGDAVIDLLDSGVITGKNALDPSRPVTAGQLIGTNALYDHANEDDRFWLSEPNLTHNPTVLAGLDTFVSVVSGLQVDVRGQVNSEVMRGIQVAGVGGALDFATGAKLAAHGLSIVALPSSAARGEQSRIVSSLTDGVVTLPATLVDVVVTEHGVADLRGLPLADRRSALASLASPPFRDELAHQ